MWCSGDEEAKSTGSTAASRQLQQAADPLQHRRHLKQTICETKLRYLRHCSSNFVLGEAPFDRHPSVQPGSAHPDFPALRTGGTGQQNLQRAGSQRFTGCWRYTSLLPKIQRERFSWRTNYDFQKFYLAMKWNMKCILCYIIREWICLLMQRRFCSKIR